MKAILKMNHHINEQKKSFEEKVVRTSSRVEAELNRIDELEKGLVMQEKK